MSLFADKLTQWAALRPDAPFVIEAETGRALTYRQCASAVRAMRGFFGETPCGVALTLPGGIANAVTWISALTAGHTLVPLSPNAANEEKFRAAALYQPDILVVEQPEEGAAFARPSATIITQQALEQFIADAISHDGALPPAHEGQLCLTTSGTTGEPKGVCLTERQLAWTAEQVRLSHRLTPADRGLTVLPFSHINAPVVSLCATLLAGATVVIAPRFSRNRFWSWIEDYQITWASIVPAILAILLQTEKPAFLPGALRFVRTASAPLPFVQHQAFERKFGIPVIETYGLSEAASQVTANPVPPGQNKPGSVGLPIGVSLRICSPRTEDALGDLQDVAPGATGEICVRGPSVISAYWGGAGANSFQDGWFRTGDLGYCDEDGYVYITGRLKEVINRGGEKIAPREIEEVLLAHPAVKEVAVAGRPDPIYGEQVIAYVVPAGAWDAHLEQDLRALCLRRLSPHKVPTAFVALDALPRNRTGKIIRQLLGKEQELLVAG
jgi:acyl-CoA synthetase (AMP-forming)/AMP-acid ligase II